METTPTAQQINETADRLVDDFHGQIFKKEGIADQLRQEDYACDDPSDPFPEGKIRANRDVRLSGIQKETSERFSAIRAWWERQGFVISEQRTDGLWAENAQSGFGMNVTVSDDGTWAFGISSPCVFPNGVPPED